MTLFHVKNVYVRYKMVVAMSATSLFLIFHGIQYINTLKNYNFFTTIGTDLDYQFKGRLTLIYIHLECLFRT